MSVLGNQAQRWGTPTARDMKDGTAADYDYPTYGLLGRQATRWQTPSTDSFRQRSRERGMEPGLDTQARRWPTPPAQDSEASGSRNAPGSNAHPGTSLTDLALKGSSRGRSRPAPATGKDGGNGSGGAVLNPRFVETLMGLKAGWTSCVVWETRWCPRKRRLPWRSLRDAF